ncbi:Dabb family protein [Paraburkholderia xenovorans]|uniref:Dabb family protein n=1 Tax=Paraburkholderia xenovorans TaxID=36873 RepID=UPI0038BB73A0
MIKHIVMWTLKGSTAEEKAESIHQVKAAFAAMKETIPGLVNLEIGVDISSVEYSCDVVLYSEFESPEALEHYAVHPAHLQVKERLAGLRIARHQVDYLVE